MAWPTPQEYNEAIQNPRTAFVDAELRAGQPVLTPLGLPRPITGNFASVYQMVCANQRVWAVRCFLRDFADHQERYAAISGHLAQTQLPYMVDFTFLADGIRIGGRTYPILKMAWLEGESFLSYVERNLHAPARLLDLAQQWVEMAQTIGQAGIAHGDLQHGNILVVNGRLRLIDYDGMYVPALDGRRSHEVGHRNYQHPARTEDAFGPETDHFSTWIIYSSLVALSADPALWQVLNGGDECLLFRHEDFLRPERSAALRALEQSPDARLTRLADVLRTLLALAPEQIPAIDGQLTVRPTRPRPPAAWVQDHLRSAAAAVTGAPAAAPVAATPSATSSPQWIEDFIGGGQRTGLPAPAGSVARERVVAGLSTIFAIAAWILLDIGAVGLAAPALLTAALVAGNLGYLADRYRRKPDVRARRAVRTRLADVERGLKAANRTLTRAEQERAYIQHIYDEQVARLDRVLARVRKDEQAAYDRLGNQRQARLDDVQVRAQRDRQAETAIIARIQADFRRRIAQVDQQLATLHQAEADERKHLLQQRRTQFVADFLKRHKIDKALIAGVGPGVKERLKARGIERVLDITPERLAKVPGVGDARAEVLLNWRKQVEALAWQGAPTRLDRKDDGDVRRRFERLAGNLSKERKKLERKLDKRVSSTRDSYAQRARKAAEREKSIEERHRAKVAEVQAHFREKTRQVRVERQELDRQAAYFLAQVDRQAGQLKQDHAQLVWSQKSLASQLDRADAVDFPSYVRRVVVPL